MVLPVWSAEVDPRVLAVRTITTTGIRGGGLLHPFGLSRFSSRVLIGLTAEHVRADFAGGAARLDVIDGSLLGGPVSISFELAYGTHLPAKLAALRDFQEAAKGKHVPARCVRLFEEGLRALHAFDARLAGASLREIAKGQMGEGAWPGDGEHRKSRARRLVAKGEAMISAGPAAILA